MSAPKADIQHEAVLLIGPYRSGKTRRILRQALELKSREPLSEVVIVVPSARYANLMRRRLLDELDSIPKELRPPGIFGLKILPFYEICRSILRPVGIECRQLPEELRGVLMKSILTALANDGGGKALAPIAHFQGTVPSVVELVDELQRAGLSPQEVMDRLELSASTDSLFYELAVVYRRYWEKCGELRVFDLKQIALAARELLYAGEAAPDAKSENDDTDGGAALVISASVAVAVESTAQGVVDSVFVETAAVAPPRDRGHLARQSTGSAEEYALAPLLTGRLPPHIVDSVGGYPLPILSDANGDPYPITAPASLPLPEMEGFLRGARRRRCDSVLYDLLLIDGFDRISHLQAQLFGGLAKHARSTIISFDFIQPDPSERSDEIRNPATGAPDRVNRTLDETNRSNCDNSALCDADSSNSNLAGAESSFSDNAGSTVSSTLSQSYEDYQWKASSYRELLTCIEAKIETVSPVVRTTPEIECFSCLDRFVEMREIARRCKEAVVLRNIDPSEILVVARSIESYAGAIEAAFDDAGLDYFIDGSIKISSLAQWHFVRRLLSLPLNDFSRREVIDVVRSPYFNGDQAGLSSEMLSKLDRKTHKMEMVSGLCAWKKFFELSEDMSDERIAVFGLFDMLLALQADASLERRIALTEDILELFMKLPANERHSRTVKARMENELLRSLRRAFKTMLMQESVLENRGESAEEFIQRLIKVMEAASFARAIPKKGGIVVCSADLAPSRCFEELFVAGMVEGDFPRRTVGRGFLASDQIMRWLSYGIDLQNPRAEPGFERALFYSLLERARNRVVLSLPQFEIDGGEPVPSFYLKELEETHNIRLVRDPLFLPALMRPASVSEALAAATWIGGFSHCEIMGNKHPALYGRVQEIRSGFNATISRITAERNQVYNAYLTDFVTTGALKVPLPEAWTASKLNKFGQCPFRFWVGEILKMEPREEAEPGLTSLVRGEIYHKILEQFFVSYRQIIQADESGDLSDSEEREAIVTVLIEHAFSEGLALLQKKPLFAPGPWWEQEKKEMLFRITRFIKRELKRIADDRDRFAPALFEVEFGTASPTACPPLVLQLNDETITLRGTVDRIDLFDGRIPSSSARAAVRVVDYKTGGKSISHKDALSGRNIQIPIYALAVEQAILPGSSVLSGLYMSISQGKATGILTFDSEKHSSLLTHTARLVGDFVTRIKQGDFVPAPTSREVCTHCPHRTACRVKELKGFTEAESDALD